MLHLLKYFYLLSLLTTVICFHYTSINIKKQIKNNNNNNNKYLNYHININNNKYIKTTTIQMNLFEDAFRFFTNLNKEASAKHILIKGPQVQALEKLKILKDELNASKDINLAFSELASKVSECPSASRGNILILFVSYHSINLFNIMMII